MLHLVLRFRQGIHAIGHVSAANHPRNITNRPSGLGLARRPAFVGPLESRGRGAVTRPGRGDAIRLWHYQRPWPRGWVWRLCGRWMVGISCTFVVLWHRITRVLGRQSLRGGVRQYCFAGFTRRRQHRALQYKRRRVVHATQQVSGRGDTDGLQSGCSCRQLSETLGNLPPASVSDGFPTAVSRVSFSLFLAGILNRASYLMRLVGLHKCCT